MSLSHHHLVRKGKQWGGWGFANPFSRDFWAPASKEHNEKREAKKATPEENEYNKKVQSQILDTVFGGLPVLGGLTGTLIGGPAAGSAIYSGLSKAQDIKDKVDDLRGANETDYQELDENPENEEDNWEDYQNEEEQAYGSGMSQLLEETKRHTSIPIRSFKNHK